MDKSSSVHGSYSRLLHQARILSESHLETIETTLGVLEALVGLSPHVDEIRAQLMEKKKWAQSKQENLVELGNIEKKRHEKWNIESHHGVKRNMEYSLRMH